MFDEVVVVTYDSLLLFVFQFVQNMKTGNPKEKDLETIFEILYYLMDKWVDLAEKMNDVQHKISKDV